MDNRFKMMPRCIGQHEPTHPVCDGANDRPACSHLHPCKALQLHCLKNKTKPKDYIRLNKDKNGNLFAKPFGENRFNNLIVEAMKIQKEEEIIIRNPRLAIRSNKSKMAKQKRNSAWAGNFKMLDSWCEEFGKLLAAGTGLTLAKRAVEAWPGDLYMRDRRDEKMSEVAFYVRGRPIGRRHGYDFPIVELKWRIRDLRMDARYPIPVDGFKGIGNKRMPWIKPQVFPLKSKHFVSYSYALTRPQLRMCCEILIDLIRQEIIKTRPDQKE